MDTLYVALASISTTNRLGVHNQQLSLRYRCTLLTVEHHRYKLAIVQLLVGVARRWRLSRFAGDRVVDLFDGYVGPEEGPRWIVHRRDDRTELFRDIRTQEHFVVLHLPVVAVQTIVRSQGVWSHRRIEEHPERLRAIARPYCNQLGVSITISTNRRCPWYQYGVTRGLVHFHHAEVALIPVVDLVVYVRYPFAVATRGNDLPAAELAKAPLGVAINRIIKSHGLYPVVNEDKH
ncbi:hypothetical protein D3C87_1370390 [compost metagenome]